MSTTRRMGKAWPLPAVEYDAAMNMSNRDEPPRREGERGQDCVLHVPCAQSSKVSHTSLWCPFRGAKGALIAGGAPCWALCDAHHRVHVSAGPGSQGREKAGDPSAGLFAQVPVPHAQHSPASRTDSERRRRSESHQAPGNSTPCSRPEARRRQGIQMPRRADRCRAVAWRHETWLRARTGGRGHGMAFQRQRLSNSASVRQAEDCEERNKRPSACSRWTPARLDRVKMNPSCSRSS